MAIKLQYMVVALLAVAVFGPDKSTAAPAPAPAVASAPASTALPTGNATEPVLTLVVNPWAAGRIYAPVSVPTGSSVEFVWNGAHGVYLLDSSQCPTNYTAGANMLYNISSATSVNNNYTATLQQPGVYYFSCPVTGHCPSGQLQTISVLDPAPGTVSGLLSVT